MYDNFNDISLILLTTTMAIGTVLIRGWYVSKMAGIHANRLGLKRLPSNEKVLAGVYGSVSILFPTGTQHFNIFVRNPSMLQTMSEIQIVRAVQNVCDTSRFEEQVETIVSYVTEISFVGINCSEKHHGAFNRFVEATTYCLPNNPFKAVLKSFNH